MENQENNQKIREAIRIAKNGDKTLARQMITEIVDLEPENEQALLAYAFIAPNALEAEQVLEEILRINPNNTTALKQLSKLRELNLPSLEENQPGSSVISPFTEIESPSNAFTQNVDYNNPTPVSSFGSSSYFEQESSASNAFVNNEPRKVPCIQCGRMIEEGTTYCSSCKQDIDHRKLALSNPQAYANQKELEKKIDKLIQIQQDQSEHLRKINRAAQLYFWVTIISFVLSLGYICFLLFGLTSLIGGSSGFDFPMQ